MTTENLHVLMIDDDAVDRQSIRRMLQRHQPTWQLTLCENSESGLAALQHGRFDVVLLDYLLPGETGLDVIIKLTSQGHRIPVIALSGHADQGTAINLMRHGAADYLIKDSLQAERLITTIDTVIINDRMAYASRKHAETLSALVRGTARSVGLEYLRHMTRTIATSFAVSHVLFAVIDGAWADCLSTWSVDGFLYPRRFASDHQIFANVAAAHHSAQTNPSLAQTCITFGDGMGTIEGACHALMVRDASGSMCGALILMGETLTIDHQQRNVLALCVERAEAELARVRADQLLAERLRIERALSQCACTLLADRDPDNSIMCALEHLLGTTQGDALTVLLLDSDAVAKHIPRWNCVGSVGKSHGRAQAPIHQELNRWIDRWWSELAKDRIIASPIRLLPHEEAQWLCAHDVCSVLAVPLRWRDTTIGYIRVDHRHEYRWSREEVAMVRSGGALVAAYLEHRRAMSHNRAMAG
jgi:DNA-binding NarL/FixJ family response regulator